MLPPLMQIHDALQTRSYNRFYLENLYMYLYIYIENLYIECS